MSFFGGNVGRKTTTFVSLFIVLTTLSLTPATAQELKFDFNSPSFGGNPFNSTSLLAIATAQRPAPKTVVTTPLTAAQTFAAQLQARLLSAFSSGLVTAITGSASGASGSYDLGGQRVTFSNDGTNITVTIVDDATGETTVITVPVYTSGRRRRRRMPIPRWSPPPSRRPGRRSRRRSPAPLRLRAPPPRRLARSTPRPSKVARSPSTACRFKAR